MYVVGVYVHGHSAVCEVRILLHTSAPHSSTLQVLVLCVKQSSHALHGDHSGGQVYGASKRKDNIRAVKIIFIICVKCRFAMSGPCKLTFTNIICYNRILAKVPASPYSFFFIWLNRKFLSRFLLKSVRQNMNIKVRVCRQNNLKHCLGIKNIF